MSLGDLMAADSEARASAPMQAAAHRIQNAGPKTTVLYRKFHGSSIRFGPFGRGSPLPSDMNNIL
jgi:hypothetical protein